MSAWNVSVGSLAMGPGTPYGVTNITGWLDRPAVRVATLPKSGKSGHWDTREFIDGRVITIDFDVASDTTTFANAIAGLDAIKSDGLNLQQVTVELPNRGPETVMARVRALMVPTGQEYEFGFASCSLQMFAPDPVRYGVQLFAQTTLSGSSGGAGLTYPLAYPLNYGVPPGVTPGALTLSNTGAVSYFPRLRINGPVTNPVVTLVETGDWVRYNAVLPAGQHLDINWTVPRRVTIGDNPVSVRNLITYSGNWLAVPSGGGSLSYSADTADPAATLSVWSYQGAWE